MPAVEELALKTRSPGETEAVGAALSRLLPPGSVVALRGELATGKTCMVRGIVAGLGGAGSVHSPTFTLVNEYHTRLKLYHLDLYRLASAEEVADLGYQELFEPDGVAVVEWAERAEPLLPAVRVDIALHHAGGDLRRIIVRDSGVLNAGWQESLGGAVADSGFPCG